MKPFVFAHTAPTSPPGSFVAVSVNSTMISLRWNRISCIDRNSEIIGYRVMQLAIGYYSYNDTIYVPGTALNNRRYNLTGVVPAAEYSIAVAAVNRNGTVGPFTESVIVHTDHPESKCSIPYICVLNYLKCIKFVLSQKLQVDVGLKKVHCL